MAVRVYAILFCIKKRCPTHYFLFDEITYVLDLTHPSIFPSFPLWVHETDRTISVSRSKAFSLFLNSCLWLFPALTLTTFWILKCEPQAWMRYLIHFSRSALYGGKLTSPSLLLAFCVLSIPRQPLPIEPLSPSGHSLLGGCFIKNPVPSIRGRFTLSSRLLIKSMR